MQVNYQKDINHNYMTIQAEKEIDMDCYPIRMLLGNEIASLISCRIQAVDGKRVFCYEVGSRETVESRFFKKKLTKEDIRFVMQGIFQVIQEMQAYLLDVNQLVILPELMYYDRGKHMLQFCYFPGYDHQIQEQIRSFLEQILPLIDHGDATAVAMGYGMYQKAIEKNFQLEQMKECLYKEEEVEKEQPRSEQKAEQIQKEEEIKTEEAAEKEKIPWDTLIFSCLWTVALLGICCLRFLGYLDFLTTPMILGIFIFVMSAVCINAFLWKRQQKKGNRGKKSWAESSALQASIQWPGKSEVDVEQNMETKKEEQAERSLGQMDDGYREKVVNQSDNYERQPKEQIEAAKNMESLQKTEVSQETKSLHKTEDLQQTKTAQELDLGDTQPLPVIRLPENAWLISRETEKLPDIELTGDLTVIGKAESVDVKILLPTVSRVHAKIWRDEEQYYLRDLDSRNGTFVNGNQISGKNNCRILPGDEVRFADAVYIFRV